MKINPLAIYFIILCIIVGYFLGSILVGLIIGTVLFLLSTIIARNDL